MPYVTWIGYRDLADDVLGDNLVSNPYLVSATTGYTAQNSGTIARVLPGLLRVTNGASASSWASTPITTVAGKLYRIDVDVTLGTAPGTNIYASTTNSSATGALNVANATTSGTVSLFFVATGTTTYILLQNTGATTAQYNDYDNIRCREVLARGHATTIEHVINRLFSVAGSWTAGTGWSVGSGVATCDGTQTTTSNLENPTLPSGFIRGGKDYVTTFTLSGYTAGTVGVNIGGTGSPEGTARSANGTYTETITVLFGGAPTNFRMLADADFAGVVDSISMKLAADQEWALDFDIQEKQPTHEANKSEQRMLDGSTDTLFWSGKSGYNVTTQILPYGEWQFLEEFIKNAVDGQTVTFDPTGTESQPKEPGDYVLAGYSLARIIGGGTTERRQYQLQFRAA